MERVPHHKRIDKEKYQKDLERFYTDNYDMVKVVPQAVSVKGGDEKSEMGDKIVKLQDEMSRQKQQFRDIEESKRQKIPGELLDKPKTNAQRLDKFIR